MSNIQFFYFSFSTNFSFCSRWPSKWGSTLVGISYRWTSTSILVNIASKSKSKSTSAIALVNLDLGGLADSAQVHDSTSPRCRTFTKMSPVPRKTPFCILLTQEGLVKLCNGWRRLIPYWEVSQKFNMDSLIMSFWTSILHWSVKQH